MAIGAIQTCVGRQDVSSPLAIGAVCTDVSLFFLSLIIIIIIIRFIRCCCSARCGADLIARPTRAFVPLRPDFIIQIAPFPPAAAPKVLMS